MVNITSLVVALHIFSKSIIIKLSINQIISILSINFSSKSKKFKLTWSNFIKKKFYFRIIIILRELHALKNLTFQFTPVTHMVYLEIRLHYLDFAIEKLTSSNWISKYTMSVTGVNWKVKFLSACILRKVISGNLEHFLANLKIILLFWLLRSSTYLYLKDYIHFKSQIINKSFVHFQVK